MQSEDLIFATYHNAGLRVYDLRNAFEPKELAYFVRRAGKDRRSTAQSGQGNPILRRVCRSNGLMYLTDTNAGLYILQYEGQ